MTHSLTNNKALANSLLALIVLALPACTVAPWEHDFWHPPAATGVVPIADGSSYPVTRASGEGLGDNWPNLADVPEKVANPLPAATAGTQLDELASDRAAAQEKAEALQAVRVDREDVTESSPVGVNIPDQPPATPEEIAE